jgi:hypothetical protein
MREGGMTMRIKAILLNATLIFCAVLVLASCGRNPSAPTSAPATRIIGLNGNLAFGDVVVGSTGTLPLTITNNGTVTLTVTSVAGPSGFTSTWLSGTIPPGGSQSATISFAPTAAGSYTGTLTVVGDQTSGTSTIAVSGTAYSNMNGAWSGTHTISAPSWTNICTQTLIVNSQTGGLFSGTWRMSGGTIAACDQAGTLSGSVSATDSISGLTWVVTVNPSTCTRVAGDGIFSGTLSNGVITAQMTEMLDCGMGAASRTYAVRVTKQ